MHLNVSGGGDHDLPRRLFRCSDTLSVKKFLLMLRWNFLSFSLQPLFLILLLGTTEKSLAPASDIFTGINETPSQPSLLQTKQAHVSQPLLTRKMLQTLSGEPATPPSFISSADLLRVNSISSSKLLINKLNKTRPQY